MLLRNGIHYKIGVHGKIFRLSAATGSWILSTMSPAEYAHYKSIEKLPQKRERTNNRSG